MMVLVQLTCLSLCLVSLGICEEQGSYLHDPTNVHNAEHIKQHMGEYFDDDDDKLKLDDDEAMEFHYFKLHDYDNNNKLDGHELGVAMTHYHETTEEGEEQKAHPSYTISDEELANLVELILKEDDLNDDGYVDYYEFVQAARRGGGDAAADDKDAL